MVHSRHHFLGLVQPPMFSQLLTNLMSGVREVILQRSGAERKTQGAMVSASALAGGVSGGVGGLLRIYPVLDPSYHISNIVDRGAQKRRSWRYHLYSIWQHRSDDL